MLTLALTVTDCRSDHKDQISTQCGNTFKQLTDRGSDDSSIKVQKDKRKYNSKNINMLWILLTPE